MIARMHSVVIDCPDPRELAVFYEAVLGLSRIEDTDEWVTLEDPAGPRLCFQRIDRYAAPDWPTGSTPTQVHLDLLVEDLDVGERKVLALGARLLEGSDKPIGYRVYADPGGHPFCLVTAESIVGVTR